MISVDIDTRELDRYRERLGLYMQLNRRDVKELVRRKGNDLRIALYREYRRFAPDPGESILEAKARSWRVRRRGVGISPAARKRAAAKLGGHQSILVSDVRESVSKAGTRTIRLTGVRQTKRGQRTTGGRSNRGGRAVSGLDALIREPGDIVLNRRAVEVVEEVNLREKARVAAATGWLAGRRALRQKELGASVRESVRNRTGTMLGVMDFTAAGDAARISFTNAAYSARYVEARGATARALRAATSDLDEYIARKTRDTILESGVAR